MSAKAPLGSPRRYARTHARTTRTHVVILAVIDMMRPMLAIDVDLRQVVWAEAGLVAPPDASGNFSSGRGPTRELSWEAPDSFLGNKVGGRPRARPPFGVTRRLFSADVLRGSPQLFRPLRRLAGQGSTSRGGPQRRHHSGSERTAAGRVGGMTPSSPPQGNGRALRLSPPHVLFLSPSAERSLATRMLPGRFVDHRTGEPVSRDDLLSVFAGVTSFRVRVHVDASAGGAVR